MVGNGLAFAGRLRVSSPSQRTAGILGTVLRGLYASERFHVGSPRKKSLVGAADTSEPGSVFLLSRSGRVRIGNLCGRIRRRSRRILCRTFSASAFDAFAQFFRDDHALSVSTVDLAEVESRRRRSSVSIDVPERLDGLRSDRFLSHELRSRRSHVSGNLDVSRSRDSGSGRVDAPLGRYGLRRSDMKCRFLISGRCYCGISSNFETSPEESTCRACRDYEGEPRGAGDIVHEVATALRITEAAKKVFGGCGGCERRRALLNAALPLPDRSEKESL